VAGPDPLTVADTESQTLRHLAAQGVSAAVWPLVCAAVTQADCLQVTRTMTETDCGSMAETDPMTVSATETRMLGRQPSPDACSLRPAARVPGPPSSGRHPRILFSRLAYSSRVGQGWLLTPGLQALDCQGGPRYASPLHASTLLPHAPAAPAFTSTATPAFPSAAAPAQAPAPAAVFSPTRLFTRRTARLCCLTEDEFTTSSPAVGTSAPESIRRLVALFDRDRKVFLSPDFKEEQLRLVSEAVGLQPTELDPVNL